MRRWTSVPLATMAVLLMAVPVMAYTLYGYFNTSAIDTDLNGRADLSVCYDVSTNSPIYINRSQIDEEIERWHAASVGAFSSNGICNNDGSNIKILQMKVEAVEVV